MSFGLLYWVLMILSFIFGLYSTWPAAGGNNYKMQGMTVLIFILFLLLGWSVYGAPIHEGGRSN